MRESERARVIAVAEYWDDHPHLTRREVERALGLTHDIPDSIAVDGLKEDVLRLSKQVASMRKTLQEILVAPPPQRRPKGKY